MPLLKYSELTEEQKKLVALMYSDLTNQEQYLYRFDGDKYSGRQYVPPSGVTKDGIPFGSIHNEPVEETKEVEKQPERKVTIRTRNKKK